MSFECKHSAKIIGTCKTCKRPKGILYRSLPTALSSDFRVDEERPFKYTGIDYCASAYIKTASHTKKNYIALMTCEATRMIHLELLKDYNITCLMFEDIRWKKSIAKINVVR